MAYDEGMLIGVLTGTGGISGVVADILAACTKDTDQLRRRSGPTRRGVAAASGLRLWVEEIRGARHPWGYGRFPLDRL